MHTPQEYDKNTQALEEEELKLAALQEDVRKSQQRIIDLKCAKSKMHSDTLWQIAFQKQHEENVLDSIRYFEQIEKFKEENKNNRPYLLDMLTPHYMWMVSGLSNTRKSILWIIVKAWKPLSSAEISQKFNKLYIRDNKMTSSKVAASLNWKLMNFIPKNKSYEFSVFERTPEKKIAISNKDPDFLPFLEMRWKSNNH